MTVGDILTRNARKFADRTAVIPDNGAPLSYGGLNDRVNRLARFLMKSGLKKGDRIGVLVHNSPQFIEIYFAAAKTGGIFCPYNNHLTKPELKALFDYSTPRFLFVDTDFAEAVNALLPGCAYVSGCVCLQEPLWASMQSYETVLSGGDAEEPGTVIHDDDVVSMFFTAGTTGRPKGALRTHHHLMMNAMTGVMELKVDYDERVLITIPMYHVAGEDNITRHSFMPNTLYIRREGGFKPAEILGFIEKERITRCQMVPTMIHAMLQLPDVGRFDVSSLRSLIYTGAPMPAELLKRALQVFRCGFIQLYGQTEAGPLTTMLRPEDHIMDGTEKRLKRLASVGKAVLDYEVRIVNEKGEDAGTGGIGEIVLRSEAMMKAYWRIPEETEKKLKDGWLYTGDLGRLDEDGYVYIVERKNDMIISGGVNIYPREIEEVLYMHEAVLEASVIGVPDDHWGEAAKAIIVLKEGARVSGDEIIRFCGEHLAGYKKPKSVEFWRDLPKSTQGKVLKREIRARYREEERS